MRDLREENEELKDRINAMNNEINEKNKKIAQLDTMNMRRATYNNYATELHTRGKLSEEEKEGESEEDELSELTGERRPTEEYNGQERKQKIKCSWHEKGGCNKEECKFRHLKKVCKYYNQDYCKYGDKC